MAYSERTGEDHPMLAGAPVLPSSLGQLWSDFIELHNARPSGMGISRIGFPDIDAFERVNRVKFDAWELAAIRGADSAYIESRAK